MQVERQRDENQTRRWRGNAAPLSWLLGNVCDFICIQGRRVCLLVFVWCFPHFEVGEGVEEEVVQGTEGHWGLWMFHYSQDGLGCWPRWALSIYKTHKPMWAKCSFNSSSKEDRHVVCQSHLSTRRPYETSIGSKWVKTSTNSKYISSTKNNFFYISYIAEKLTFQVHSTASRWTSHCD